MEHKSDVIGSNCEILESGRTIPIRFSRQSTTELLVAAEQTASFFPYNRKKKKKNENHKHITPSRNTMKASNNHRMEKRKKKSIVAIFFFKMVKMPSYSSLSIIHQSQNSRSRLHLVNQKGISIYDTQ